MKVFFVAVALFLLVTGSVRAQDRATPQSDLAPAPAVRSAIDPAKEADIRHLLDVTRTAAVMQRVMGNMEQSIRPLMTNTLPPGEYRDRLIDLFFRKFQSKLDMNRLLDLAVVRYNENFSDEEIKELTKFYETPLGQKVTATLPKITGDLQQDGQALGKQLGRDSMLEVLAEHPDLAQALQAASQQSPRSSH